MGVMDDDTLSIGEVSDRSGVERSALRFYESRGLITATRTDGGQRQFPREMLRRIAFIRIAQRMGLSLDEIARALDTLAHHRTPTPNDWARLSRSWRQRLDEQIAVLERLRDDLSSCIGCGCLSFRVCRLYNPGDSAAALGPGPRYLLGDTAAARHDGSSPANSALS